MPGSVLGTRVLRLEDKRLLTGEGKYVGDFVHEGCLEVAFVRSSFPHAQILSIDKSEAEKVPGVAGVFTIEDLGAEKLSARLPLDDDFLRTPLANEVVRFVGESVVLVLAESREVAKDAAELVEVEYEPLPSRAEPEHIFSKVISAGEISGGKSSGDEPSARGSGDGVSLFPERESGDIIDMGFREVEGVHAEADVLVSARLVNNRMAVVPMEGHSISVVPPELSEDGRLWVWLSSQSPHSARDGIAESVGIEEDQIRLISPWVGGGFGAKAGWQADQIAVIKAACLLKRSACWQEERSENLLSMHGRDQIQYVRMGATRDGKLTSLEVFLIADVGAYPGIGALLPMGTRRMSQGVYNIGKIQFNHVAIATNKTPLGAFRGAGRPEASALVERMVDLVALELQMDPAEVRRRNFIPKDAFPLKTVTGATYDCGDYEKTLEIALEEIDYPSLRAEQKKRIEEYEKYRAEKDGGVEGAEASGIKLLGIGLSCYVEITGGEDTEYGSVEINPDGTATIRTGTSSHGQGHETAFSMIVSEALGIPLGDIEYCQSDTDTVPKGAGTWGSRSAQVGGSAVLESANAVLEQAKELAAHLLEANPKDIVVIEDADAEDGSKNGAGSSAGNSETKVTAGLTVTGSPATVISWKELAVAAADSERRPETLADKLFSETDFGAEDATYPFGSHVALVEVDVDTGKVELLRHVAVDDCGKILNPLLVEGQQHGGMTSGISQALYENMEYDSDGIPRTTSLAEYLMPSAAEFPTLENLQTFSTETPTPLNPLGAKGIGESGSVGATPAVQNAVVDALSHLGVRHIDLPLAPERVWQAIQTAKTHGKFPTEEPTWPNYPPGV